MTRYVAYVADGFVGAVASKVTGNNRYTDSANMARMATLTANHITERTTRCFHWSIQVRLGALAGQMTRYVAYVADGFISAVASKVTGFTAVVASLVVAAVCSNVARLVAVVA